MLYSMTGYGRAEQTIGDKFFIVEVRSLNGKQYDIRLNIPALLKPCEIEIRSMLNEGLIRGSIECTVLLKQNGSSKSVSINTGLLKAYYAPVAELAKELNLSTDNILSTLLKLPDVVSPSTELLTDDDAEAFKKLLQQAIDLLNKHRSEEGKYTEEDLLSRMNNIEAQQAIVATLEPARRAKVKDGLKKVLEENVGKENYDPNRLEQELIYYIEKIDITV